MKNSAKIRTMSDDLKGTESDSAKQNEQQEPAAEIAAKKTQQPSAQLNSAQSAKTNTLQAVRSDMRQQPAELGNRQSEIKEKTIPKHFDKTSSDRSVKPSNDQDDKLKKLIKKISDQTDKDSDDKYKTEEKKEIAAASQIERNDIAAKETEIVNELAGKNESELEIKKEDLPKEAVDKQIKKEVGSKNAGDIDKLKKLIHRISEPKPRVEEKPENKTGDLENAGKDAINRVSTGNATNPLIQKPKENIQQEPAAKKSIEKEEVTASSLSKKPKKSFWKNISEKLKKSSDSEKINALSGKKKISDIKANDNDKAKDFASQSGILLDNKNEKQKEAPQKENSSKKAYYDKSYISPNERLIHGKQKYYSSVSKRIKLKGEKDELKDLENAAKMKKQEKIITKKEEYKKLKKSIVQKYHIKLFRLPWKKIIFVAGVVFILTGSALYFVSKIKSPIPPAPPALVVGSELKEFSNLEKEITITKKDLKGFNILETDALAIFNSDEEIKIIKLLIVDNETDKNILTLRETLDAIDIIDIKEGINYLPEGFLQATTDNYNLFLFKTKKNSIRYGLAVKIKDENENFMLEIMEKWEEEESKNKKMTTILKPLFRNDRNFEDVFSPLSEVNYRGIKIKYISLIDSETALDYFIYKNILVFATSKDSAFLMADLLTLDEQN